MKTCRQCGKDKPLGEFHAHSHMRDGHLNKCKVCVRTRIREHSKTRHGRLITKAWHRTPKGRAKERRNTARMREKYPERYKANTAVNNALRDGRLHRKFCEVCGAKRVQAHHDDYGKPLEVRWLCFKHHRAHHLGE